MIHCGVGTVITNMEHALLSERIEHRPLFRQPGQLLPSRQASLQRRGWERPGMTELSAERPEDAADLLARIAGEQDRDAFEALFRHFAPRVKAYMLKLGTEVSLADELAQETMLMVWRKAVQFDRSKASPSTWIFTIARNLRIDAFRKINRPELDPNDPALVPEAEEPADQRVEREQYAVRIRAAMEGLNDEQAEVVRLSFFEDKSHSEIAEELGIPLGTVKSRLRLAFGRVREALEDITE